MIAGFSDDIVLLVTCMFLEEIKMHGDMHVSRRKSDREFEAGVEGDRYPNKNRLFCLSETVKLYNK